MNHRLLAVTLLAATGLPLLEAATVDILPPNRRKPAVDQANALATPTAVMPLPEEES